MLDCRTTCGGLPRQERKEVLPALLSQFLQGCQRDGRGLRVRRKRMLTCPARHMAALSHGLMDASEAKPVQTERPLSVRLVQGLEQEMHLWNR